MVPHITIFPPGEVWESQVKSSVCMKSWKNDSGYLYRRESISSFVGDRGRESKSKSQRERETFVPRGSMKRTPAFSL